MAASAAVNAIKRGCEMLHEGRTQIENFKKTAESAVGDAKALYKEVTGFWGWVTGLFGKAKPSAIPEAAKAAAIETTGVVVVAQRQKATPLDYDQQQIIVIHEVAERLGEFFDIRQRITSHYKDLEDSSLHVYEEGQNHAKKAIERVEVELQIENLTTKIRETMVYAPTELKDLYSRFLEKYSLIKEEQEFARQEQLAARRYKEAKAWQHRNFRIEVAMWAVGLLVVLMVLWGMILEVEHLTGLLE